VKRHTLTRSLVVFATAAIWANCASPAPAQAPGPGDSVPLIILVRHAEKACTPEDDPPLSQAGKKRAEDLAAALGGAKVRRVITTDFRRTSETAAPLAQALALHPVVIKFKDGPVDVGTHIGKVVDAIRASNDGTVLVVGHTITIPDIIDRLGGPKPGKILESEYSNLFVLVGEDPGTRLVRSHYGAADSPQPACN
jgi:broad specificity phosphatase PhoE